MDMVLHRYQSIRIMGPRDIDQPQLGAMVCGNNHTRGMSLAWVKWLQMLHPFAWIAMQTSCKSDGLSFVIDHH